MIDFGEYFRRQSHGTKEMWTKRVGMGGGVEMV